MEVPVLTSSTRWLLPVGSINGETETATSVAREWLASKHALNSTSRPLLPHQSNGPAVLFRDYSFPFYAFVPACLSLNTTLASMSMSNRRRFWGIIQQFQVIWRNYRTTGWEWSEMFSMFGVEEVSSDSDESDYDILHDIGVDGEYLGMYI
jgi:hypothetical protein